jgi:hypothetical protein
LQDIVALERVRGSCPVVTFRFGLESAGAPILVTLTLCEWQRIAQRIADAAVALGS